jgi:DNA-directed RNA polymerase subunit RPC12/RpoP
MPRKTFVRPKYQCPHCGSPQIAVDRPGLGALGLSALFGGSRLGRDLRRTRYRCGTCGRRLAMTTGLIGVKRR